MILRVLFAICFVLMTTVQAWACSCAPWSGGNISEITDDYVALWGTPINSQLEKNPQGLHKFRISYTVEVLDSFGRLQTNAVTVKSFGVHGGSCGKELRVGTPQFLVLYKRDDGTLESNQCAPEPPYELVKQYLEIGVDTLVPSITDCISKEGEIKTDIEGCDLWKSSYKNWGTYGFVDWRLYQNLWTERLKTISLTKTPWWKFGRKKVE